MTWMKVTLAIVQLSSTLANPRTNDGVQPTKCFPVNNFIFSSALFPTCQASSSACYPICRITDREELSYANLFQPTKFIGTIAKFLPEPAMMSPIDQKDFRKECDNLAELVLSFVIIL
jgi:hypothetical protein